MNPHSARTLVPSLALAAALSIALHACGGGGSGGGPSLLTFQAEVEPNDSAAEAAGLTLGRPAGGEVATAGDQDWWSIRLARGEVIQIELFAARFDHDSWDLAGNAAQLAIVDRDGSTELAAHHPDGVGGSPSWSWGEHDLDVPLFRAPESGTYYIRVNGADPVETGGEYALVATRVTLPGVQLEAEGVGVSGANDTPGTAQAIVAGTVYGFHVDDEDDFYSFAVFGPTLVELELTAYRNGVWAEDDDYYDPQLALYDTDGVTLLDSDDDSYFYDPAIRHWIAAPGTYFVRVGECCGDGDAPYFLHVRLIPVVGSVPEAEGNNAAGSAQGTAFGERIEAQMASGDEDYYSLDALAGDVLFVRLHHADNRQDALGSVSLEVLAPDGVTSIEQSSAGALGVTRAILPVDGTYFVRCTSGDNVATDYAIELRRERRSGFEVEPNDTEQDAGAFNAAGLAAGVIETLGDEDLWSFPAQAERLITITCVGDSEIYGDSNGFFELSGWGSGLAPLLEIVDTDGVTVLATSRSATHAYLSSEGVVDGLPLTTVVFVAPQSATYHVRVSSDAGTFGPDMLYALKLR